MQLESLHQQQLSNRQYLRVMNEYLTFVVQQSIASRDHEEDPSTIWEVSDINRGNFLELLQMRSKYMPGLKEN